MFSLFKSSHRFESKFESSTERFAFRHPHATVLLMFIVIPLFILVVVTILTTVIILPVGLLLT